MELIVKTFPDLVQAFCMDMEYEYYPHYSGRGMYGRCCPGIVHGGNPFAIGVQLAAYVTDQCADLDEGADTLIRLAHMVGGACSDSLGTQQIFYFPNFCNE